MSARACANAASGAGTSVAQWMRLELILLTSDYHRLATAAVSTLGLFVLKVLELSRGAEMDDQQRRLIAGRIAVRLSLVLFGVPALLLWQQLTCCPYWWHEGRSHSRTARSFGGAGSSSRARSRFSVGPLGSSRAFFMASFTSVSVWASCSSCGWLCSACRGPYSARGTRRSVSSSMPGSMGRDFWLSLWACCRPDTRQSLARAAPALPLLHRCGRTSEAPSLRQTRHAADTAGGRDDPFREHTSPRQLASA